MLGIYSCGFAQTDTIDISGVEIQAGLSPKVWTGDSRVVMAITRREIGSLPVSSLNDLLKYALNADIRKRGTGDVQADVSLRGSSFEQVLILLNGIVMNDPQTGHHQLDLPVNLDDIERIEILEGPGSRIFGPNAFAGVINIITGHSSGPALHTALSYGSFGTVAGSMAASFKSGKTDHYISLAGNSSDGYRSNTDFSGTKAYYRGTLGVKNGRLGISAGWMNKGFGANGFYSPKYPDQFEATRTEMAGIDLVCGKRFKIAPKFSWRRHHDRFELFRNAAPAWYSGHNYHMTDVLDAALNMTYESKAGITTLGLDYRYEHIFSNVLGASLNDTLRVPGETDGIFTKADARKNFDVFAGHDLSLGRFALSAGLLLHWSDAFGFSYYPGIDISCKLLKQWRVFASVNKSLRLPTFTELYYKGPVNIGNSKLKPEESWSAEGGLKYAIPACRARATVFFRHGFNLIDWIQRPGEKVWHTENLTQINTWGAETSVDMDLAKLTGVSAWPERLSISYSFLDMQKNSGDFISYYVMDYLRHKIAVTTDIGLTDALHLCLGGQYFSRAGSYIAWPSGVETAWEPVFLADAGISWRFREMEIRFDGNNLFNNTYTDYGNIPMPGINWKLGIVSKFGLNHNTK